MRISKATLVKVLDFNQLTGKQVNIKLVKITDKEGSFIAFFNLDSMTFEGSRKAIAALNDQAATLAQADIQIHNTECLELIGGYVQLTNLVTKVIAALATTWSVTVASKAPAAMPKLTSYQVWQLQKLGLLHADSNVYSDVAYYSDHAKHLMRELEARLM